MGGRSVVELLKDQNVSRESLRRLDIYIEALSAWQRRINLIGPSTVEEIWTRHVMDALQVIPLLPEGTKVIADLGSGAGVPGLVIAIAAELEAHLYESNGKKAAFLRHAGRVTGARVIIHQERLETLSSMETVPRVQAVLARALAPLPLLLEYAEPFLAQGAIALFHKGRDVDKDLTEATKYWKIQALKHSSITDSRGVILEVKGIRRV